MKGVVRENPEGVSYTSLGGAIIPIDMATGQHIGAPVAVREARAADDKSAAVAESLHRSAPQAPERAPVAAPQKRAASTIGPRDVVRAAKARIKDIKAELRTHAALKRELAELERLVAAAKKPVATVRELRRSG